MAGYYTEWYRITRATTLIKVIELVGFQALTISQSRILRYHFTYRFHMLDFSHENSVWILLKPVRVILTQHVQKYASKFFSFVWRIIRLPQMYCSSNRMMHFNSSIPSGVQNHIYKCNLYVYTACMPIYIYIYIHVCVYVCMCVYTYAHTWMRVCVVLFTYDAN